MTALSQDDVQETRDLLLGRRIVSAEVGSFEVPNRESWCNTASGRMVLDDGTRVYVVPNEGGCSCGGGDYALEHLATVDNVITDVRVVAEDSEYGAFSYRIYVVADAVEINAVQIDGDDGSGYYGTGYVLHVIPGGGDTVNVDPKALSVVMIAARIQLQDVDLRLDDLKEQHQHHNTQATSEPTTAAEKLHAQRAEITQRHLRQAQELRDELAQALAGLTR